jgi:hypothetical protein
MTERALRRWLVLLVPVLLVAVACSQAVSGKPVAGDDRPPSTSERGPEDDETAEPSTSSSSAADQGLEPLVGSWSGEYTCLQGVTGLKLTVEPVDAETVRAVFEFFAVPENPGAKEGSYQLLGAYRGDRLVFRQEKWIKQPENYLMVDLEVTSPVEPDMDVLSGNVLSPDCKGFSVRRDE